MVKAKKSLGQNFLKDESVLARIVEAADISPTDHIIEIGPGKAALTHHLLPLAEKVTAVELDDRLIPLLHEEFKDDANFELIHGDALTFTPPSTPYKIVANIPYYITSPLLNHFLLEQFQSGNPPQTIVFMVQKEVGEKIMAPKGRHSLLSLQVHLFGEPEYICTVPSSAFDPAPKVDSAVIKITVAPKPKINADLQKLFWLFKVSFAQKRKKLSKNLAAVLRIKPAEAGKLLDDIGIDPNVRAEALTIEDWQQLASSDLHARLSKSDPKTLRD